ncbi:MAG TPA: hypothetical protein VJN18_00865 [Polyangiaceae bacterium]|nr:hypothetical protein [Polyangiaceae bacterium]
MVAAPVHDLSVIPSAPLDDLDLDREGDEQEWERRAMALAATRIDAARVRLQRLGVIDVDGKLVSTDLPADMLADSDTTLETG